jgi:hypothetical protein
MEVVPELGQLIRCRDRVWAVNEVRPRRSLEIPILTPGRSIWVLMSSLGDDGFGDELTVIWELVG